MRSTPKDSLAIPPAIDRLLAASGRDQAAWDLCWIPDTFLRLPPLTTTDRFLPMSSLRAAERDSIVRVGNGSDHGIQDATQDADFQALAGDDEQSTDQRAVAAYLAGKNDTLPPQVAAKVLPLFAHFATAITGKAALGIANSYDKLLTGSSISARRYAEIVRGLEALGLARRRLRFSVDAKHDAIEAQFAATGQLSAAPRGRRTAELVQVDDELSELRAGQDRLLPALIARYLYRKRSFRDASACVRYGDRSTADFDVVVPERSLAFEVKVYEAPAAASDTKVNTYSSQLHGQILNYVAAGFSDIVYVSNLDAGIAAQVVKRVRDRGLPEGVALRTIEGPSKLWSFLDGIA